MRDAALPQAFATVTGENAVYRGPDAHNAELLTATNGHNARSVVLRRTVWEARRVSSPVELVMTGDHGEHRIVVSPDGAVTPSAPGEEIGEFIEPFGAGSGEIDARAMAQLRQDPARSVALGTVRSVDTGSASWSPKRASFIESDPVMTPTGAVLDVLARWGITIKPSPAQAAYGENVRATARHWGDCRTIAVVNGKGGVGKTMTSAMLAAVFARNGGGAVLAWDNNDTRGTLGWRTESGHHDANVQDALDAAESLLAPGAAAADIASYVHHQTQDRYDVLRSNPQLLAASQRIGKPEFDQLMRVAARYYRLVIIDSGNDESAGRWLRMIDSAAQLVVPTLATPESAESASLLLHALTARDEHCAQLAREAVVVVTQSDPGSANDVARVATAFEGVARAVRTIPFDPALKGGALRFDNLRPTTQRAWTAAAAATAANL